MERKRRILLIATGILAVGFLCLVLGAFWSLSDSDKQIHIEGNLSPKDAAEIKAAVNRFRRPAFSLRNFRNFPAEIKRYHEQRIGVISVDSFGTNACIVLVPRNANPTTIVQGVPRYQLMTNANTTNSVLILSGNPRGPGYPFGRGKSFFAIKTAKGWIVRPWDVIII